MMFLIMKYNSFIHTFLYIIKKKFLNLLLFKVHMTGAIRNAVIALYYSTYMKRKTSLVGNLGHGIL